MNIFSKYDLYEGRMISGSKSGYRDRFPKNRVIFNANIVTDNGKVWYGDLDITVSEKTLMKISEELSQELYILYEMDARFGTENAPIDELKSKAAFIVYHDKIEVGEKYKGYF